MVINNPSIKDQLAKFLTKQPLSVHHRHRLELVFAIVASAAAIVLLSSVVRPDPAKLAARQPAPALAATSLLEKYDQPITRPERATAPRIDPAFIDAIARGDLTTMEKLYDPKKPKEEMLSAAAHSGDTKIIEWVLARGANIHEAESTPRSPVLLSDANEQVTTFLLDQGAAEPSLVDAAVAGAVNAVARILKKAGPAEIDPPGRSPLAEMLASQRVPGEAKLTIAEKLLAAKANPNRDETSSEGYVPLRALTAALRDCEDGSCLKMVHLLMKHHARADSDTLITAMTLEASSHDGVLDAILKGQLEPGVTARALADFGGREAHPAAIKKVVAKGVDWAWHDGEPDAYLPVVAACARHDRDLLAALLAAGAPANRVYKDNETALGAAVSNLAEAEGGDEARVVEMLVARGADVNRRMADGRTPLFAAAEAGNVRLINVLIDKGARVNELVIDDTALNAAEQNGHIAAARVIHARGGRRGPERPVRGW